VLKPEPEQKAEELAETIKNIISSKDDLIYEVRDDVKKTNVISPSTVGDRDMIVEVELYNVADPESILDPRDWKRFGELGVDVDSYDKQLPTLIEFHKRFSR